MRNDRHLYDYLQYLKLYHRQYDDTNVLTIVKQVRLYVIVIEKKTNLNDDMNG